MADRKGGGREVRRSLMRKEDRDYRREKTAWLPVGIASVIGRAFFFPTLFWNVALYYVQPNKFQKWWSRIDDNVVLGALPFYWHCNDYLAEGIRGVINTCDGKYSFLSEFTLAIDHFQQSIRVLGGLTINMVSNKFTLRLLITTLLRLMVRKFQRLKKL